MNAFVRVTADTYWHLTFLCSNSHFRNYTHHLIIIRFIFKIAQHISRKNMRNILRVHKTSAPDSWRSLVSDVQFLWTSLKSRTNEILHWYLKNTKKLLNLLQIIISLQRSQSSRCDWVWSVRLFWRLLIVFTLLSLRVLVVETTKWVVNTKY